MQDYKSTEGGILVPVEEEKKPEPEPEQEIVMTVRCKECGEEVLIYKKDNEWGPAETTVGYISPPGHDHNNNCLIMVGRCLNDHLQEVSIRRKCSNPNCNWVGKEKCFCHPGKKVDKWPWAPGEEQ